MATLPNIGNINPLGPQVTYPYNEAYPREGQVEVTLYSLPWNETNLPSFTSKASLDNFLDTLSDSKKLTLSQFKNTAPQFTIPLEIPYASALSWTYIRVRTEQAAPERPLPFDILHDAKRDYYYFVDKVSYAAPSTSYFDISLDIWHTFFDEIEISGGDLKRGHIINEMAPTVSEYLSNPREHTSFLTSPDWNLGDPADNIRHKELEPYGGGGKNYFVIWGNFSPVQLANFSPATLQTPSPSDQWGSVDYEAALPIPHAPQAQGTGAPNGIYAFALEMSEANEIIHSLDLRGQHILQRTLGAAVLPESLIQLGEKIATQYGDFYPLQTPGAPLSRDHDFTLTADKWEMPKEIKDFTKAYTYPYAHIVIETPTGVSIPLQIETVASNHVKLVERLCSAFPWIGAETFLENIKDAGAQSYQFRTLTDGTANTAFPKGEYLATLTEWQIPTFSIWRTAAEAYQADNQGAILASKESASTSLTNTNQAADTAYANTVASTATSVLNQSTSNSNNTSNTTDGNTTASTKLANDLGKQRTTMNNIADKAYHDKTVDNNYTTAATMVNAEALSQSTTANGISGIASGLISGGASGFAVGGPAGAGVGAIAGLVGGAAQWVAASYQTGITINQNEQLAILQTTNNNEHYRIAYQQNLGNDCYAYKEYVNTQYYSNENQTLQNDFSDRVTARNNATALTIANNNKATTDANAARSRDLAKSNAQRSYNTAYANAQHIAKAASIGPNIPAATNGGQATTDALGQRFTAFMCVRQADDALKQLAQLWKRYGYSYNGRLTRSLTPATSAAQTDAPCTFWQIENLTFSKPLMRQWQERIENLFSAGVTFWKNPIFTIGA